MEKEYSLYIYIYITSKFQCLISNLDFNFNFEMYNFSIGDHVLQWEQSEEEEEGNYDVADAEWGSDEDSELSGRLLIMYNVKS